MCGVGTCGGSFVVLVIVGCWFVKNLMFNCVKSLTDNIFYSD